MFRFLGGCSGLFGGVPDFLGGVPGFGGCSGFWGCSGMFRYSGSPCSGVPGSTACPPDRRLNFNMIFELGRESLELIIYLLI